MKTESKGQEQNIDQYSRKKAPYYLELDGEVSIFLSAYEQRLPVMLKGPTGCGKTRFLEYMSYTQVIEAPDEFMLVISYNPGYQSIVKNLKQSTRQRFIAIDFCYPPEEKEIEIVVHESGVSQDIARSLVKMGQKTRSSEIYGLEEMVGTRQLIYAARLIKGGVSLQKACAVSIVKSLTDDAELQKKIEEMFML